MAESRTLDLIVQSGCFAVCRLPAEAAMPTWATSGAFFSVTRTNDELSIVCAEAAPPRDVQCERGWRCIRVAGQMEFSLTGVLSSLVNPLAAAGISVFALSTFDTDYLLIPGKSFDRAQAVLRQAGHIIA